VPSIKTEKKSLNLGSSYSSTGDEDINDVATMGGVNLVPILYISISTGKVLGKIFPL
jgi:hypothetical protein